MKTRKIVTLFLAVVLAMTMGFTPVFADDSDPAEVKDAYEYDGVKYVNAGDENFSTNQTAYYKAMLGNKLDNNDVDEDMRSCSISDLWTQLAFYLAHYNSRSDNVNYFFHYWNRIYDQNDFADARNLFLTPDTGNLQTGHYTVAFGDAFDSRWNIPASWMDSIHPNRANTSWWRDTLKSAANGEMMANAVARQAAQIVDENRRKYFPWADYPVNINTVEIKNDGDKKLPDEEGPVFYTTLGTASEMYRYWAAREDYDYHTIVVAFSDFNVTPIIPDENETAPFVYVTSSNEESSSSNVQKTVSDVKNASSLSATASQSVSESISSTISSGISGSSSYSESKTHKAGIKVSPSFKFSEVFSLGGEVSYETSNTVTETVSKGWSKGESVTTSDSESSNISVTLPPYTAVLLSQKRSTDKITATYNCPVALNFKVTVYYAYGDVRGTSYTCIHFNKIAEFGGGANGSALEDLYERYNNYKVAGTVDRGQVSWDAMSEHCADAIETASSTATFGSTQAEFTNVIDKVKTEVDSVLPIKPIYTIKPVNVAEGSTLTNQSWDYDIDMNEGDSEFISNKVKLKALNDVGAEFATFNQAQGYFTVVDENGIDDTSVAEIKKVNGQSKLVAKDEGTAYLKYVIDDKAYQTAEMAAQNSDEYITNEEIAGAGGTAIIQVNVHHKHNLIRHAAKDPTCTEDGNIAYWECSKGSCGKLFSDKNAENEIFADETVDKKTGHEWGEWEVTVEPTETTEGEQTRECLNGCGEKKTRVVPVLTHKHKMVKTAKKLPTCTEDGNIMYYTCSECGWVFTDYAGNNEIDPLDTVLPAIDHKWDEGVVTKEPTATEDGVKTYSCTVCGETKTEAIPKLAPSNGDDGTPFGKGASVEAAEAAILALPDDNDPAGTAFGLLQLKAAKVTKDSIKLNWKAVPGANRYIIFANKCGTGNKYKKLIEVSGTSLNVTQAAGAALKKGTYYKFMMIAADANGKVITTSKTVHAATKGGKVGNHKKVTVKKTVTKKARKLKKGKTLKLKAKAIPQARKLKVRKHRGIKYESSNPAVAKVNGKGVVKGVRKGTCYIYAYAQNGTCAKVKVTVK